MLNSNIILICLMGFCIVLALVVKIIQKPKIPYEKEIRKLLKLCGKKSCDALHKPYYMGFCTMIDSLDLPGNEKKKLLEFLKSYLVVFHHDPIGFYWFPPYDMEARKAFLNQIFTYLKTGKK